MQEIFAQKVSVSACKMHTHAACSKIFSQKIKLSTDLKKNHEHVVYNLCNASKSVELGRSATQQVKNKSLASKYGKEKESEEDREKAENIVLRKIASKKLEAIFLLQGSAASRMIEV